MRQSATKHVDGRKPRSDSVYERFGVVAKCLDLFPHVTTHVRQHETNTTREATS